MTAISDTIWNLSISSTYIWVIKALSGLYSSANIHLQWFNPIPSIHFFRDMIFSIRTLTYFECPLFFISECVGLKDYTSDWIGIHQWKILNSNHIVSNLHVQQLNAFVLKSKEYSLLAYVHRGYPDETYFGLFALIVSVLLAEETVFGSE